MAVRRIIPDMAYGIGDALIPLAPLPIVARRNPGVADQAQLGTTWVNESTGAVWILARIVANASDWVTSSVIGGAGVFTSLQVTTGDLTIDPGAGGIVVGGGLFAVSNAGDVVTENLVVNGDATFGGDFDLTSAALIDFTSTLNAAPSISLTANGGANEQILLNSVQGTSATSIEIASDLGGVHIEGNLNTANAIVLEAGNAAGGVTVTAGTAGIALTAVNGPIAVTSGTGAISISSNAAATTVNIATGAAVKTVTVGSTNTTSATTIQAGTAGITLSAPFVALPGPVYVYTGAGAPGNGLALHVGDLYINTTAASAATRMYIATGVGAWTNITCAA